MEPDTASRPRINRNTFKIGSGDLQQQVANNTKRIRVISTMLRSSRRGRSAEGLTPQSSNIQQSLEQSNLILADIAIQLQQDFDSRQQIENRLLQKNKEDQLELRRRNKEEEIEYKKSEKKITKSTKKIKGPLDSLFKIIGKILLLFGGLVLIKALIQPGAIDAIANSEKLKQAKETLSVVFETLTKNMKALLVLGGAFLGLGLVASLSSLLAIGTSFLAIISNPLVVLGLGLAAAIGATKYLENKFGTGEGEMDKDPISRVNQFDSSQSFKDSDNTLDRAKEQARENLEASGGAGIGVPGLGGANPFKFGKIGKDDKKLVEENNKNLKKENLKNNKVTKIEIEGEKIDLRKQKEITQSNNQSATTTPNIASVDTNNYKIKEFPEIAGFSDSVFS